MYCIPALASAFHLHVQSCATPAACEDVAQTERASRSIAITALSDNNSQHVKKTNLGKTKKPNDNDSQRAAFVLQCGCLVTPALCITGETFRFKTLLLSNLESV